MKTNVVMLSPDRELFGIKVRQESKTGFLNLSDLQNAYDIAAKQYRWSEKQASHFFQSVENCERVYELLLEMKKVNSEISLFTKEVQSSPAKYLKSLGVWKTTRKDGVSVDPYIWVSIAMWMNPKIYAKTVIWLTDALLFNRVNACGLYKELSSQVTNFDNPDYAVIARALNFIVFGRHESGIRQTASAEELNELADLEKKMAFAIEMGYIKTQDDLLEELRKVWTMKFNRKIRKAA